MSEWILTEIKGHVLFITFNRIEKRNAFNDLMIKAMTDAVQSAQSDPHIRLIAFRSHGPHFCAGADLEWMQKMINYSHHDNTQDALALATLLKNIHTSQKPTLALVQGGAFGGGAGLVAATDFAIADSSAHFCFSEIKLGLLPAVISPYVLRAIGHRATRWLFLSAKTIEANAALHLGLIQELLTSNDFFASSEALAIALANQAPESIAQLKPLLQSVDQHPINDQLNQMTAEWIASKRVSAEGQQGMHAFLTKTPVTWSS